MGFTLEDFERYIAEMRQRRKRRLPKEEGYRLFQNCRSDHRATIRPDDRQRPVYARPKVHSELVVGLDVRQMGGALKKTQSPQRGSVLQRDCTSPFEPRCDMFAKHIGKAAVARTDVHENDHAVIAFAVEKCIATESSSSPTV
jgi:hypothetical protein